MGSILKYTSTKARRFFLDENSYYNFDLPIYFTFQNILDKVSKKIDGKPLNGFFRNIPPSPPKKGHNDSPRNYENVNYKFLNNKDGKFSWRPLQLIHPALYVSLVHEITTKNNWKFIVNRFNEFNQNPRIKCLSIPLVSKRKISSKAAAVKNWWMQIEQKSIELALEYEYVLHTDVSDCYGSIYTHSIAWALHSKDVAKRDRDINNLLGNNIDRHIQDMSFGQTNGIPQGSVLMDFLAEMVLGYADLELSIRLENYKISDFQIIRYRDDYRVFTNNPQDAELILKQITEILIDLGMRLNAQKTLVSNNVVHDSVKPDKLYWLSNRRRLYNLQEHLLLIHSLSQKFPNSGTLLKALIYYFNRIKNVKKSKRNISVLISILIDIAYKNPKTYPIASAILSKLLSLIKSKRKKERILISINKRFEKIPNTGHLQIWLQRITIKIDDRIHYNEKLCNKISNPNAMIWNSDWLSKGLKTLIESEDIIDRKELDEMDSIMDSSEVELFQSTNSYNY